MTFIQSQYYYPHVTKGEMKMIHAREALAKSEKAMAKQLSNLFIEIGDAADSGERSLFWHEHLTPPQVSFLDALGYSVILGGGRSFDAKYEITW